MGAFKPTHIIILLVIVLLLFGAKRLPDLAKSVGQSLKIFKKEMKELTEDDAPKAAPTVQVVTPEQGAATPPATPVDVTATPPRTPSGSTTPPQA